MFRFLKDMLIFPFEPRNKQNRCAQFLRFGIQEYPAFLWEKPSIWRVLLFPFLVLYHIFASKNVKEQTKK